MITFLIIHSKIKDKPIVSICWSSRDAASLALSVIIILNKTRGRDWNIWSIEEGRAVSESPHSKFGYFLSISKQGVSANIIQKVCLLVVSLQYSDIVASHHPPPPLQYTYNDTHRTHRMYSLSQCRRFGYVHIYLKRIWTMCQKGNCPLNNLKSKST